MRRGILGTMREEIEQGIRRARKARALSETAVTNYARPGSFAAPAYGPDAIRLRVEDAGDVPSAQSGAYADMPAAGNTGAIYISTDAPRRIYRDNGVSWDLIATADHGTLAGLSDDDHSLYHTDARALTWHSGLPGAHVTNGDSHDHSGGDGAPITWDHVDSKPAFGDASLKNVGTGAGTVADGARGVTNGDSHDHSGGDGAQIDHGGLAGLGDDDHTIYALLNGRTGGQTLIGGTAAGNNLTLQSTSHATRGMIVLADPTLGHSSTHAAATPALANNHCGIALEHDPNNQSVLVYGFDYGSNPIFQVAKKGYTGTPYAAWDPSANIQFQVNAGGSAWFAGNVEADGLLKVLTAGAAAEGLTRIVDLFDTTAYAAGVGAGVRFLGKYDSAGGYAGFGGIAGVKANGTDANYAGELVLYARANGANLAEAARLAVGTDSTRGLTVRQDSADANEAAIRLYKTRSGGAVSDNDFAGVVSFEALNDAGTPERIVYADIRAKVLDASDGTEDGELWVRLMSGGTLYRFLSLSATGLYVNGYLSALGAGGSSPYIAWTLVTGTTAAAQGGTATAAHGVDATKILAVLAKVQSGGTSDWVQPAYTADAGYQFDCNWDATNITIKNHPSNSGSILSKAFKALVIYGG